MRLRICPFRNSLRLSIWFEPKGQKASRACKDYDDWWREVALFYIALSPDPKDLEHFIKSCAHQVMSKTADRSAASRLHLLLEGLMTCFPGAQPDFKLNGGPNHLI